MHVDDARVFVQLGSEFEDDQRPGPIPLDVDRLDLQQGFADYKLAAGLGQFVLRAGRQEMSYDEGAIIGLRDGPNVRLAFDGARASYVDPSYALDAFAVQPVNASPAVFDDADLAGQAIYGVHATLTPQSLSTLAVDSFLFGNTMPAVSLYPTTEPEQTATFGTRWRLSNGGFDGAVCVIGQTGTASRRRVPRKQGDRACATCAGSWIHSSGSRTMFDEGRPNPAACSVLASEVALPAEAEDADRHQTSREDDITSSAARTGGLKPVP